MTRLHKTFAIFALSGLALAGCSRKSKGGGDPRRTAGGHQTDQHRSLRQRHERHALVCRRGRYQRRLVAGDGQLDWPFARVQRLT